MNSTPSKKNSTELAKTAKLLRVIAHPIRLQILALLDTEDSLTVTAISNSITDSIEQSMLSHHLIKMKDNGVLKSRKVGKFNHYSIVDKKFLSFLNT